MSGAADVTELLFEFLELIHQGPDNLNAAPTEKISVLVSDPTGEVTTAANALVADAELGETTQHPLQYVQRQSRNCGEPAKLSRAI